MMERELDAESVSLWGVLHDGELRRIDWNKDTRSLSIEVTVGYLSSYYDWPADAGIVFQLFGLTSAKVNQWIPQPGLWNEDLGSRRWTPRDWTELVEVVPPNAVMISEATVSHPGPGVLVAVAGHEVRDGASTNIWLELTLEAELLRFRTPDGSVDLDKLIQLGDAYWDNLGKKRRR
jgi:hypothetical protein